MTIFDGPIFVHSDVGRGLLVLKRKRIKVNTKDICSSIFDFLSSLSGDGKRGIILPAFNYDFGKTRIFNPSRDPIQVGALPEWVRLNGEFARSGIPFFSTLSIQECRLDYNEVINPFGNESSFSSLIKDDGGIILMGTDISSMTLIHHVEELAGKPCYRYDKTFRGSIVLEGDSSYSCVVRMHVRPMGIHLEYDWERLQEELIHEDILQTDEDAGDLKYIRARKLIEYWGNRISSDPFYLLDKQSRDNFEGPTFRGTKRVSIEEYEASE